MDIGIVITSCKTFVDITVPPLLASLFAADVPCSQIHVVVGECDDVKDEICDGVHFHSRKMVNIDNNGLLWLTQEKDAGQNYEWIVYLHDTCLVDEAFWKKCHNIYDRHKNTVDCIRIHQPYSMGIGMYKVSWLKSEDVSAHMRSVLNYDIATKNEVKQRLGILEDTLFKFAIRKAKGKCMPLMPSRKVVETNVRMYNTDVPRIKEYYSRIGIYKIKANWGQSRTLTTEL